MMGEINFSSEVSEAFDICHYGIKGQKWYQRRFQNADGSLTPEGKIRYSRNELLNQYKKGIESQVSEIKKSKVYKNYEKAFDEYGKIYKKRVDYILDKKGFDDSLEPASRIETETDAYIRGIKPTKRDYEKLKRKWINGEMTDDDTGFRVWYKNKYGVDLTDLENEKSVTGNFYDSSFYVVMDATDKYSKSIGNIKPVKENFKNDKDYKKALQKYKDTHDMVFKTVLDVYDSKVFKNDIDKATEEGWFTSNYSKEELERVRKKYANKNSEHLKTTAKKTSRSDQSINKKIPKAGSDELKNSDYTVTEKHVVNTFDKYGEKLFDRLRKIKIYDESLKTKLFEKKALDIANISLVNKMYGNIITEDRLKGAFEKMKNGETMTREEKMALYSTVEIINNASATENTIRNNNMQHKDTLNSNGVQFSSEVSEALDILHYGIKGMKWYQRRYQNKDGSLTPLGRQRYQEMAASSKNILDVDNYTRGKTATELLKMANTWNVEEWGKSDSVESPLYITGDSYKDNLKMAKHLAKKYNAVIIDEDANDIFANNVNNRYKNEEYEKYLDEYFNSTGAGKRPIDAYELRYAIDSFAFEMSKKGKKVISMSTYIQDNDMEKEVEPEEEPEEKLEYDDFSDWATVNLSNKNNVNKQFSKKIEEYSTYTLSSWGKPSENGRPVLDVYSNNMFDKKLMNDHLKEQGAEPIDYETYKNYSDYRSKPKKTEPIVNEDFERFVRDVTKSTNAPDEKIRGMIAKDIEGYAKLYATKQDKRIAMMYSMYNEKALDAEIKKLERERTEKPLIILDDRLHHSDENGIEFSDEVLEALDILHHGVMGQTHGERRYQNKDGTWTELGKRRRRSMSDKIKHQAMKHKVKKLKAAKEKAASEKAAKEASEAAKKRKLEMEEEQRRLKEEEIKKQRQAEKEKVLKTGKASEVAKYKNELTPEERTAVLARFKFHEDLDKYVKKEPRPLTVKERMEKITEFTNTAVNLSKVGIQAWNVLASTYNSTVDKDSKLSLINLPKDNNK